MLKRLLFALALALGLAAPASAHAQARPAAIMARIGELDAACRSAGGRPANNVYVFVHDYTGDGIADYLISEGDYQCRNRAGLFRQNGQAVVEIFVVNARGIATRVFRERLLAYRILDQSPRLVQIAQTGAACGAGVPASTQCGASLQWNARANSFDVVPTGSRAAPGASVERPAATAPAAAPPVDRAAYLARCRARLIAENPQARAHADESCAQNWRSLSDTLPLIDAILALTADPAPPASAAAARARLPSVRWSGQQGRLGQFAVTASAAEVQFGWSESGMPIPYAVTEALEARGASVALLGCEAFGAGESTRLLRVTPAGRPAFVMMLGEHNAPTASASSNVNVTIYVGARPPTLRSLQAQQYSSWRARCDG